MKLRSETIFFIGIILVSAVIIVGAVVSSSSGSNKEVPADLLIKGDSPVKGTQDSRVVLVEFGDFQCPACKAAAPVLKRIEEEYEGRIRLVFRHFPLPVHGNAQIAAQAAEAAGEQGKFWEFHDILYGRQDVWVHSSDPKRLFEDYAREIGLDMGKFKEDLDSGKVKDKVERDVRDGKSVGIDSTPTVFLNGEKFVGVPSYEDLKAKIDRLLN